METKNITWHKNSLSHEERSLRNGHPSFVLWLTGLSGAGKSTLANALEVALFEAGIHTYLLDGDNLRMGINRNLGFSAEDRSENIRRVGEVAKLFVDAGMVIITAVISPLEEDRRKARASFQDGEFIEVFVDCPIDVCKERDPKGLYKKALEGEIKNFTGIDSPYERPVEPEMTVRTDLYEVSELVEQVMEQLKARGLLKRKSS